MLVCLYIHVSHYSHVADTVQFFFFYQKLQFRSLITCSFVILHLFPCGSASGALNPQFVVVLVL